MPTVDQSYLNLVVKFVFPFLWPHVDLRYCRFPASCSSAIRTSWLRVRTPVLRNSCWIEAFTEASDKSSRSAISLLLRLLVTGTNFSISAAVGFISLFGVSVLNGVVLIASINALRKHGSTLHDLSAG